MIVSDNEVASDVLETTEKKQKILMTQETSRRITSLRFILSSLVVFIHNNFRAEELAKSVEKGLSVPVFNQSEPGAWIQRFISQGIASCAVPLFFLFSAYLFFRKNDSYKTVL